MQRDINQLQGKIFDVLVIGSGIYGACIAWDAALRGLSVAMIDRGDFGHATSSNSLKIIHGGLRYLQDGDPRLIRKMSRERKYWMQIAPHLVHPLKCLAPTYPKLSKSKYAFKIGLFLNDLLSYDRNKLIDAQKYLPRGRILPRNKCLAQLPGIGDNGITGGALWYDAQVFSTERLLLSIVLSACEAGAVAVNYVEATEFLSRGKQIEGVHALDLYSGRSFDIHAHVVVNSTGAWVNQALNTSGIHSKIGYTLSTAINLVTRQILPNLAVGFLSRNCDSLGNTKDSSHMLFMVPWRNCSIIGTIHDFYNGNPKDFRVSEEMIEKFIQEINQAFPNVALTREDVYYVHSGFLPLDNARSTNGRLKLLRESRVYDHAAEDGISGLITVVGVKYTTARATAEKAVDLVANKLGRGNTKCQTAKNHVYGGEIVDFKRFQSEAMPLLKDFSPETIEHLTYMYGSQYLDILSLVQKEPFLGQRISNNSPIIKAEIVHAVRAEMAQKLTDVVFRRTDLATAGPVDEQGIQTCADIMAQELGWNRVEKEQAVNETRSAYQAAGAFLKEKAEVLA